MPRKVMVYVEGFGRCIVMTDSDDKMSTEALKEKIIATISGSRLVEFVTDTDVLVVRPHKISAVHIQGGPFRVELGEEEMVEEVAKPKPRKKLPPATEISDSLEDVNIYDEADSEVPILDLDDEDIIVEVELEDDDDDALAEETVEEESDVESEVDQWHEEAEGDTK